MMATFTPDLGNATPPTDPIADPDNTPNDENPAPSTPPTSPQIQNHGASPTSQPHTPPSPTPAAPHTPPSRDKSTPTPLYRRFKREVAMSPATPPRSPTREKRDSPAKGRNTPVSGRNSPAKVRSSPAKRSESPTKQKLEVGLNGFHFVCELPMSKVTPKKNAASGSGTPKKDTTSRPASPVKMEAELVDGKSSARTAAKTTTKSPSRMTGTPAKTTPARSAMPARNGSAKKGTPSRTLFNTASAKNTPKKATPARLNFGTPLRNVATPEPTKQTKSSPTKSIKMASKYIQRSPALLAPAKSTPDPLSTSQTQRPTPVKKKSYDIGGLMANLQAQAATEKKIDAEVPTPLRRAARGLVVGPVIRYKKKESEAVVEEKAAEVPSESVAKKSSEIIQVTPSAGTPDAGEKNDDATAIPPPALEHASFDAPEERTQLRYTPLLFPPPSADFVPESIPLPSAKKDVHFQDRAFTSPKSSPRVGTDPSILLAMQKEMDNLKQSLSSSLDVPYKFPSYGPANEYELPVMHTAKARRTLGRTTSDVSSVSNTTVSSVSTVRASMLMNPKALNGTSKSMRKPAPLHSENQKVVLKKTPPEKAPPTTKRKPAVKPTVTGGIPRSARNSVFEATQPTSSSKAPSSIRKATSTRKPLIKSNQPTPSSKPAPPLRKTKPAIPARPAIKKFVSATEIAGRVAGWNNKVQKKKEEGVEKQSFTPEGSPTKSDLTPPKPHLTPIKPDPTPNTKRSPLRSTSKIAPILTPKRAAPRTPGPLLPKPAPRTPAMRKLMDPNAYRTPSKEIEGSLDEAINRKIEEDKRRGQ